jgi:hypothetical protein
MTLEIQVLAWERHTNVAGLNVQVRKLKLKWHTYWTLVYTQYNFVWSSLSFLVGGFLQNYGFLHQYITEILLKAVLITYHIKTDHWIKALSLNKNTVTEWTLLLNKIVAE